MNIIRLLDLPTSQRSLFLWGPRKTGKSFWLKSQVHNAWTIDLLESDTFLEFAARPALLRERFATLETRLADDGPVAERIVVSLDRHPRTLEDRHGQVTVLPLPDFVKWLWSSR